MFFEKTILKMHFWGINFENIFFEGAISVGAILETPFFEKNIFKNVFS